MAANSSNSMERSVTNDGSPDDNDFGPSQQSEKCSLQSDGTHGRNSTDDIPSHQQEENSLDGNGERFINGIDPLEENSMDDDGESYADGFNENVEGNGDDWLDPALRPPMMIVNDAAVGTIASHIPHNSPRPPMPFPDHPPQMWEGYGQLRSKAQVGFCDGCAQMPHSVTTRYGLLHYDYLIRRTGPFIFLSTYLI